MDKVVVIIPARNEEHGIGIVIDELRYFITRGLGVEPYIIVATNHCSDATGHIAEASGATVVSDCCERGKAAAIRHALSKVPADAGCVLMIDADGTYPASYCLPLIRKLDDGFDVVSGSRDERYPGSMRALNAFGNRVMSLTARILFGGTVRDLCTGLWGFSPKAIRELDIAAEGFTLEAELYIKSRMQGLKFCQIPIAYRPRLGISKLHLIEGVRIMVLLFVGWVYYRGPLAKTVKREANLLTHTDHNASEDY